MLRVSPRVGAGISMWDKDSSSAVRFTASTQTTEPICLVANVCKWDPLARRAYHDKQDSLL